MKFSQNPENIYRCEANLEYLLDPDYNPLYADNKNSIYESTDNSLMAWTLDDGGHIYTISSRLELGIKASKSQEIDYADYRLNEKYSSTEGVKSKFEISLRINPGSLVMTNL